MKDSNFVLTCSLVITCHPFTSCTSRELLIAVMLWNTIPRVAGARHNSRRAARIIVTHSTWQNTGFSPVVFSVTRMLLDSLPGAIPISLLLSRLHLRLLLHGQSIVVTLSPVLLLLLVVVGV